MNRVIFALAAALAAAACAAPSMAPPSRQVIEELAPTGKVRAAINLGNPVLASRDPATGELRGVSVALSRELAKRLALPLDLVVYTAAGRVVDDARAGRWDIAFVAIDATRAADMEYTPAYVVIEGAYVVPQRSAILENSQVDREGVRVVAGKGSAYDLYLSRELRHAKIVRVATSQEVTAATAAGAGDVGAGVKQQLESDLRTIPGMRVLDGRFMVIRQAMAVPKGRSAGARYLTDFVEDMKASGAVAAALKESGIEAAAVAPPAGR